MQKETKEIVVQQNNSVDSFIGKAIEKGASIETLEKLLAMRKELKNEQAKEAFDEDMAIFQGECPVIKKSKQVMNKPEKGGGKRYSFAPLDVIVTQTKKFISQNGFSYSITTEISDTKVKAIVKVTHKLGHNQISDFTVPIDNEAYMNAPQKVASALTFAKRYAFCNAFGILTGDEDNDSQSIKPKKDMFTEAVRMIEASKTIANLLQIGERIEKSDKFTPEQKKDLDAKISAKVDLIEAGNEKKGKK